jgi:hypothetical protein
LFLPPPGVINEIFFAFIALRCSPLSSSSARSRTLASCQRRREASLRLRAHDGVGTGDNIGRFLRQVVEERVVKQKTQIPENKKQIDKTNEKKKANKMPL